MGDPYSPVTGLAARCSARILDRLPPMDKLCRAKSELPRSKVMSAVRHLYVNMGRMRHLRLAVRPLGAGGLSFSLACRPCAL